MKSMWTGAEVVLSRMQHDESGAIESAQIFAWIAVTVAAIVLLGGMLEVLGVDLINWVRGEIGI